MGPSGEGEPPRLTVAVDDLGTGLWTSKLKQELEARLPLRNVPFSLSRAVVSVEELPIRYLDARSDAQLQRLRQLAHSPVAWFRSPLVHIVLTSCPEYEDYKRDLRLRLKAMADTESLAPGQPELLFVYLRPAGADPAAKGPARAFDAMRRDLNRRRERCVRLDPLPPGAAADARAPGLLGLDDFDRQLKEALRAGFEARAAAYAEEVRRLMLSRLDPSWSFSTLFLVKDGLAAMLEAAGLLEDALREYSELEAAYLEVLRSAQQARQPFGGKAAGEDEAAQLWASWAAIRQAASQPELPPEWVMRQALFASQARLLLKLHRHSEVADRGLAFVQSFGGLLAQQQRAGEVPPQLREAWSFASYLSLAEATSRLQATWAEEKRRTDALGRGAGRRARMSEAATQQPGSPDSGPDALPVPIPLSPSAVGITSLQVKVAGSSDGDGASSPSWRQDSLQAQMDWRLGTLPGQAAAEGLAGRSGREGAAGGSASLHCLLGKLYCAARAELLRLGAAAGLDLPKKATAVPGMSEPRQHALPPPAAAAGAAAPAVLPSEAASAQQAAAAAAAEMAGQVGWQGEEGLSEAPSATDLSQVDLSASASSSSKQEPQRGAPAGPDVPLATSDDPAAPELSLASAGDGQAEGQAEGSASGSGPLSASPRQVAPAPLQRLSVLTKAGVDADSQSSSPHSTSTHQSSLQHSLSDVQGADAGHAVAPQATLPSTPTAEQNDMRTAERQVLLALAERASGRGSRLGMAPPATAAPAAAAADVFEGAELPPWLVHWRLRAALSSQQLFTELFIELSEAAARCYLQCGYLRNAALLNSDVADALAKAGSLRRAVTLYERQCRTFLREGWHALAAATLPKLAACQQAVHSPGLAHTAAAMLSLPPPFQGAAAERQAACRLLLRAAQAQAGTGASLPLLPGKPAASDGAIDLSAIIAAAPPKCAVSRFFGRTGPDGTPLLAPAPREPHSRGSSQCGACSAAVGDALPLQLVVRNQLPDALPLSDVVLTLAVLQEMTVIHSPRASGPGPLATPGAHAGGSGQRRSSAPGTPLGEAGAHALEPQGSLGRERFEPYWQRVEELTCSLVAISSTGSDSSSNGSGTTLRPITGEVSLPPGTSLLTFLAAPVQRGLYTARHLRAMLQQLPLYVEVEAPEPLWQQQEAAAAVAAAAAHSRGAMSPQALRRSSRAGVPRGGPLAPVAGGAPLTPRVPRPPGDAPAGIRDAEFVVLDVEQAQPRVQLSLVAAGGSLIAGQEQWLGLALAPERDALQHARLELTWPLANTAGLPAHSRKATGPGGMHRTALSLGGDVRLSPAVSSSALSTATPPFLRPEHRSALLLAPDGSSDSRDGLQVLPAEGPAGPAAAWLLAEGLQQQLELPPVAEGQPICLWWRVTAGEVSTPPEQVHIAPPAPRHSSRPLDPRRLAGLPADGPSPPAAALDLPASLEYSSGCQRSHCRVLAAPVRQPFSVASAARELPSGGVAVHFTLTSNLAVPAQLARLALQPQPGFALSSSLLDSTGLLPASLAPGESLTAAFLLVPESDAGGAATGDPAVVLPAKLQPSVLSVDYTVDSRQQCGVAAAALGQHAAGAHHSSHQQQAQHNREAEGGGAATDPASQQQQQQAQQGQPQQRTPGPEALDLLGRSVRRGASRALGLHGDESHPAAAGDDSGSDGEGQAGCPGGEPGGRQLCSFRHLVTLEMHASEEGSSGTVVFVRLLGPFSATVGQPTTLCWRLERGGQPDPQLPASRVSFEVQAESDHWRPLGWRQGGVTLAGHPGAVATVEATWVPLAAGTLPVPALRLNDVAYQEVFDVGLSGGGAIAVAEAG